jgi:cytosine/adenosine deaminase-related metal-dependent hydrolase
MSATQRSQRGPEAAARCFWAAALYDGTRWWQAVDGGPAEQGVRILVDDESRILEMHAGDPQSGDVRVGTLLPSFVNAHCHLELATLDSGPLEPGRLESDPATHPSFEGEFTDWLHNVIRARFGEEVEDPLAIARRNLSASMAAGYLCTSEVDSMGAGGQALAELSPGSRVDLELIGFDLDEHQAVAAIEQRLASAPKGLRVGLSPHAPYSAGPALLQAAARTGLPLSIHVAETACEQDFLLHGRGPFRDLLVERGRLPDGWQPPGLRALAYLEHLGILSPRLTLVHMQDVDDAELELAARRGCAVAICPGTIQYFGRPAPRLAEMRARGCAWLSAPTRWPATRASILARS